MLIILKERVRRWSTWKSSGAHVNTHIQAAPPEGSRESAPRRGRGAASGAAAGAAAVGEPAAPSDPRPAAWRPLQGSARLGLVGFCSHRGFKATWADGLLACLLQQGEEVTSPWKWGQRRSDTFVGVITLFISSINLSTAPSILHLRPVSQHGRAHIPLSVRETSSHLTTTWPIMNQFSRSLKEWN